MPLTLPGSPRLTSSLLGVLGVLGVLGALLPSTARADESLDVGFVMPCPEYGALLEFDWVTGLAAGSETTGTGYTWSVYTGVTANVTLGLVNGPDAPSTIAASSVIATVLDYEEPLATDIVEFAVEIGDATITATFTLDTEVDLTAGLAVDFAGAAAVITIENLDEDTCEGDVTDLEMLAGSFDADADDYGYSTDCDEADATINPGATEVCDGVDNDCDGGTDAADTVTSAFTVYYVDADADRYGDGDTATANCDGSTGVANGSDCDDLDPNAYPGAPDPAGDGVDQDCDGLATESTDYLQVDFEQDCDNLGDALAVSVNLQWPLDAPADSSAAGDPATATYTDIDALVWNDQDDFWSVGAVTATVSDYAASADEVTFELTTADSSITLVATLVTEIDPVDPGGLSSDYTGATFSVQTNINDCGPSTEIATFDEDGDSFRTPTDCDDNDATIHPDATETVADGIDQDCNGVDSCYTDDDDDNYGTSVVITGWTLSCDTRGVAPVAGDCNDGDDAINPGETEVCDGSDKDEDCNTYSDDDDSGATGQTDWYPDDDIDWYGDIAATATSQCDAPTGYVADNTDCNDADATINPYATEVCDAANTDEDCDGNSDDADSYPTGLSGWFPDDDGDGYGSDSVSSVTVACDGPAGYVDNFDDCNDANSAINRGETEVCDPSDNDEDCDYLGDDNDSSATGKTDWYPDVDGDGHGDSGASAALACNAPWGYVDNDDDCNDGAATTHPGATEVCDAANADEDCDNLADDADSGATGTTDWYPDDDRDTFGNQTATATSLCDAPAGSVVDHTDCDDTDAAINPGLSDDETVYDGSDGSVDYDCDGTIGPDIAGYTLSYGSDGTSIVATSDTISGLSVTYPAGTTFPSGTTMTEDTSVAGVTALSISGPDMHGGTKSIEVHTQVNYGSAIVTSQKSLGLRGFLATCVVDSGVSVGAVSLGDCLRSGGMAWEFVHNLYADPGYGAGAQMAILSGGMPYEGGKYPTTGITGVVVSVLSLGVSFEIAEVESREQSYGDGEVFAWEAITDLEVTLSNLSHTALLLYDDTDGDGLPDIDEREEYGTDPNVADSDGDGSEDGVEVGVGTDPLDATSSVADDADSDWLPVGMELVLGTDPNLADTDGDGVSDGLEFADGTDPLDPESNALVDTDADGFDDRDADSDGDSLPAWVEDALGSSDTDADSDDDGVSDYYELLDGTDPTDPTDATLQDLDGDVIDDRTDNCPDVANADQADADRDGLGTACDEDEGGDDTGTPDTGTPDTGTPDTDEVADTGGKSPDDCGCAAPGSSLPTGLWLSLVALLAGRRRRT